MAGADLTFPGSDVWVGGGREPGGPLRLHCPPLRSLPQCCPYSGHLPRGLSSVSLIAHCEPRASPACFPETQPGWCWGRVPRGPRSALFLLTVQFGRSVPPVSILVGPAGALHGALLPVVSSFTRKEVFSLCEGVPELLGWEPGGLAAAFLSLFRRTCGGMGPGGEGDFLLASFQPGSSVDPGFSIQHLLPLMLKLVPLAAKSSEDLSTERKEGPSPRSGGGCECPDWSPTPGLSPHDLVWSLSFEAPPQAQQPPADDRFCPSIFSMSASWRVLGLFISMSGGLGQCPGL